MTFRLNLCFVVAVIYFFYAGCVTTTSPSKTPLTEDTERGTTEECTIVLHNKTDQEITVQANFVNAIKESQSVFTYDLSGDARIKINYDKETTHLILFQTRGIPRTSSVMITHENGLYDCEPTQTKMIEVFKSNDESEVKLKYIH
jgi:3-deoxy-D-arabino-heptulosonate 7-phosphate (DAHP) synthase